MSLPDLSDRRNFAQAQAVFTSIVEQLHANGAISDKDLESPEHLWEKLDSIRANLAVTAILDHRDVIARYAAKFASDNEHHLGLMFYALFFEHSLNGLIHRQVERLGKTARVATEAIRSVNFEGKLGWFLNLIDLPALNPKHAKTISQVAQERNAFVHYKWGPMPESSVERDRTEKRLGELLSAAKQAATYLRRYEARVLHEGMKRRISEASKLVRPARKA